MRKKIRAIEKTEKSNLQSHVEVPKVLEMRVVLGCDFTSFTDFVGKERERFRYIERQLFKSGADVVQTSIGIYRKTDDYAKLGVLVSLNLPIPVRMLRYELVENKEDI